jgi:hypothetical protein
VPAHGISRAVVHHAVHEAAITARVAILHPIPVRYPATATATAATIQIPTTGTELTIQTQRMDRYM